MTEQEARKLAKMDRYYVAKQYRYGLGFIWGVWDSKSDHWVEFDRKEGETADRSIL